MWLLVMLVINSLSCYSFVRRGGIYRLQSSQVLLTFGTGSFNSTAYDDQAQRTQHGLRHEQRRMATANMAPP